MISLSDNISSLILKEHGSALKDALEVIQNSTERIALVKDIDNKLIGTMTDGDIRRSLLAGKTLNEPLNTLINKEFTYLKEDEVNLYQKASLLMTKKGIKQLPIVDSNKELVKLYFLDETIHQLPNPVIFMAGGKGKRLRPHTFNCPKPMIPVGKKPMLEILLEQCISSGLSEFYISVNYLKEQIIEYFGDGAKWGVNITYLEESEPLGTAGSLALLPNKPKHPFLVMNGDVLTRLNPNHLITFHNEHNAKATLCVREHSVNVPFGVVKNKGYELIDFEEKPTFEYLINAGVYILDPCILSLLNKRKNIDMPSLLQFAKKEGHKVALCPIHEYWIDVGNPESLEEAYDSWENSDKDKHLE